MESAGVCTGKQELLVAFSLITLFTLRPCFISELGEKKDTERWEIFCFVDFKRPQKFNLFLWGELLSRHAAVLLTAQNN